MLCPIGVNAQDVRREEGRERKEKSRVENREREREREERERERREREVIINIFPIYSLQDVGSIIGKVRLTFLYNIIMTSCSLFNILYKIHYFFSPVFPSSLYRVE